MSDLRTALETRLRDFEPPPDGLSRLHALRRRRRRNQQVIAAALALVVAGGAMFALTRAFRSEPARRIPISPPITPQTIGRLRPAWTTQVNRGAASTVLTAEGRIYVHTANGGLAGFADTCLSSTCSPVWTASLAGHGAAIDASGSRIFVTTNRLQAFAAGCATGGRVCEPSVLEDPPVWEGQADSNGVLGPPTVDGAVVYVGAQFGQLVAYRADCPSASGCGPIWWAQTEGTLVNSAPAADGGLVYVLSDRLYAFPVSCRGAGTCHPQWTAAVSDLSTAPVAAGGMVYVSHRDRLYAFSATCGSKGATCSPSWTFEDPAGASLSTPATDGGGVFVAGSKLFALDPRCGTGGRECGPVWAGDIGSNGATAPPTVGSGLVFVSTDRLLAFDQTCPAATCQPLWRSATSSSPLGRAALGEGSVAVTNADGRLTVFEVRPPR